MGPIMCQFLRDFAAVAAMTVIAVFFSLAIVAMLVVIRAVS